MPKFFRNCAPNVFFGCVAVLLFSAVAVINWRHSSLETGQLPKIIERRRPRVLQQEKSEQQISRSNTNAKVLPNGGTIYRPASKKDWESWKKAEDISVPITDIYVASAIKVTNETAQAEPDGTVNLNGSRQIEFSAWFDLAEDITSAPPFAHIQLVQFIGSERRVFKTIKVEPLIVDGQRRTLHGAMSVTKLGNFVLILRVSGRDVAKLGVRIH